MARIVLLFLLVVVSLHAQTISFSFDDGFNPETQPQAAAWNAQLLAALAEAQVPAAFFPAGRNVDSPEGMALVRAWSDAGHLIGNHTYHHRSFGSSKQTLDGFCEDILAAEKLYQPLAGWQARLRFPYLKEGESAEKRDGLRRWMAAHHYLPAPVSIDTSDWYYSTRFVAYQERNPGADLVPFRQAYLDHLWDRANYYEGLARKLLGRSPAHVVLMHTNALNAAMLGDVIRMFRGKGWQVVAARSAFEDPLYAMQPQHLPAGESILWSLAAAAKEPNLRYPAEDSVYEEERLNALGL